ILQQQRANRHDRLLAEVAIGPLPSWAQGRGLLRAFRVFRFGLLELSFQGHQVALSLLQACAMPFGSGLGHFVLLGFAGLGLLVHPLVGRLQRLCVLLLRALMVPVGTDDGFASLVDISSMVVGLALDAVLLSMVVRVAL